ncbi:efflux RND transporter periplasmic adaptor subunit [Photobacterium sagamiensis]|uniref:efflux RND transporter periplasmic adaptor subunit n=1 Tax=Photobacterium sagamiensis TaxID=2910241 RepID=UPI003D104435
MTAYNPAHRRLKPIISLIKIVLPCLVLASGTMATLSFLDSKPKRRAPVANPPARLVEVTQAEWITESPQIIAHGEVKAKRKVNLRSQLKGVITKLPPHFLPGGFVTKGEELIQIDARDHQLAIEESKATLARYQALYSAEIGRQRAAELEYRLSGQSLSEEDLTLVLRQPQLAQIEADISRSEAGLSKAKINYERTRITAPFDGQILRRDVDEGSMVRDNTSLLDIVATDTFWLEVSIPSQHLHWLKIPSALEQRNNTIGCSGSKVTIRNPNEWPAGQYRNGCVISLLPELDTRVKTASVLVEIEDPLALLPQNHGKPSVLLNAFLEATIDAQPIENVISLPRRHLHQDRFVWVMNKDAQLEARNVSLIYRGRDNVLIDSGIMPGEQIVTTPLPGAIAGIDLKLRSQSQHATKTNTVDDIAMTTEPNAELKASKEQG